jgi:hydroxylaminobenzene mutase
MPSSSPTAAARPSDPPKLMDRTLLRLGFILILLALLTGFAVPLFVNARLGLTAHIVGLLGGMMLLLIGLVSSALALEPRAILVFRWCWIYATYANWIASVLGAATGASGLTPLAGAGTSGPPLAEHTVAFFLFSLSLAAIVGAALAVWGLRSTSHKRRSKLQSNSA